MSSISISQFNWADYSIIGIIALSALISIARGFIREAISLATWIIAIWVAIRFGNSFANLLASYIRSPSMRSVIAFGGLFLIVLIIGIMINILFSQLVEKNGLSSTNRVLGLLFGVARGILLVAVLILICDMSNVSKTPSWKASQLVPQFQPLTNWLQGFVPEMNHYSQEVANPSD